MCVWYLNSLAALWAHFEKTINRNEIYDARVAFKRRAFWLVKPYIFPKIHGCVYFVNEILFANNTRNCTHVGLYTALVDHFY